MTTPRSPLRAALAALFAATFTLSGVMGAAGARSCPHMGQMAMTGAAGVSPEAMAHEDGAAQAHRALDEHGAPSSPDHGAHHPSGCTCLGFCHGNASLTLPRAATARGLADAAIRRDAAAPPASVAPRGRLALLLPYPNGPPSA